LDAALILMAQERPMHAPVMERLGTTRMARGAGLRPLRGGGCGLDAALVAVMA
jgi:hypothetical protein